MKSIGILGAGPMGLACAYYAQKKGYKVTLIEAAPFIGGMASHFELSGTSIEKFYHFICKTDFDTFELLDELKLSDKLIWKNTSMGYFIEGKLYKWGDPFSLLFFEKFSLISKIRYGLNAFFTSKRKNFDSLENLSAEEWLKSWIGEKAYDLTWKKLMDYKFYEYSSSISAAWIATRMKRVGNSRKSIFQEQLGYLEGGSETLVNALADKIKDDGGKIITNSPVTNLMISEEKKILGLEVNKEKLYFDSVISTIPTPYLDKILGETSLDFRKKYKQIENIGVVCVIYKLKKGVSKHFWVNINDERFELPGLIEFSNLRKIENDLKIIYLPYYMPITYDKFEKSDEYFFEETFNYLQMLNPNLKKEDVIDFSVNKLKYAQPICDVGFKEKIPPIQTDIEDLYIADTCFYYPEDRGVSESIKLAKTIIEKIVI